MIHTMLPTQYLRRAGAHRVDPHKRLMAAVLQAVVDDCRGSIHRRVPTHATRVGLDGVERAIAYVSSRDRAWPFSFENLCEALGLDADRLRQELQTRAA